MAHFFTKHLAHFRLLITFTMAVLLAFCAERVHAGAWPKEVRVYQGSTPQLDGVIAPGEYDDAAQLDDFSAWTPQFFEVQSREDLYAKVWLKHDGQALYVAWDVTDDVLYGFDIPRHLPEGNPNAHALTRQGFPWYGDGVELLVNASYEWTPETNEIAAGTGASFMMVASNHKSQLGGLGVGGLMLGEPRSSDIAMESYERWTRNGDMEAVVRQKDKATEGSGYVIEWRVNADPCLEVRPGQFWSPAMGEVPMGLNLTVADLDEENIGGFHHEDWWAGERTARIRLWQFGTMVMVPGPKPVAAPAYPRGTVQMTPREHLGLEQVAVVVPSKYAEQVPGELTLNVPPGMGARVFAAGLQGPRFMAFSPGGVLHVANMKVGDSREFSPPHNDNVIPAPEAMQGQILALPDHNGDGVADTSIVAVDNLWWATSLAFYKGDLYVGDQHAVRRFRDADGDGVFETELPIVAEIPFGDHHRTRTIQFDEINDKLYVSVGSSCDLCREENPERAAILEFNADGTGRRVFARGLRNAIGLAIHPETNELWATDNGLDQMGSMLPPESVHVVRDGGFHGWPVAYGYGVWVDYETFYQGERTERACSFCPSSVGQLPRTAQDSADVARMIPPVGLLPAHTAPMAIHFYTGEALGPRFKNAALVALRAGRLAPVGGHKVMALFSEPDGSNPRVADFVTGFQPDEFDGGSAWGEPTGIAEDGRGHIYISSDWTNHLIVKIAPSSLRGTWESRIPDNAFTDGRVNLLATVRVAELDPRGGPVVAIADLSALGGAERHPLRDEGDGTFTLDLTLPTGPQVGTRSIRILLEQQTEAGLDVLRFSHAIHVVRGEDLVVADDWRVSERGGVALQPVGDDGALPIRIDNVAGSGWRLTFNAPEPVAADEYRALRFAVQIDPAQLEGVQGPLSAVLLPGGRQLPLAQERLLERNSAVDLVADGLLDPTAGSWQVVEIPLEAFGLEGEPIGSIRFLGRLEGEFLLDDLRLVSHVQRPGETAVLEERGNAPAQFTLGQSYPNPFNGEVVIPFALARAGAVGLSLYDLLGQRVAVLAEGWHPAGRHEVRWDPRARQELASGVYFYRLQTASGVKFGKLILLQ